jgi:type I site-specific restriction endonuclease
MSNPSNQQPSAGEFFGEVISTYTRSQAIEDGVLIDASVMAQEVGFTRYITP